MPNRLADAMSPYLLQHADNPVNWYPWGQEAFAEAERRDVPLFVSIGYASCHWCHVMTHESFEDERTAAQLNRDFVSVKVDREERPDVDAVYMAAATALTGSGGWPLSVWLDHEGRTFLAGTYFPPRPSHGRPSFRQVLRAVTAAWTERRAELLESAETIEAALTRLPPGPADPDVAGAEILSDAVADLQAHFDTLRGGFGGAPKFPPSMVLEFLLRHYELTEEPGSLAMVSATCDAMARGGIYDQLGGGFARYSVDANWQVPHFEKMLYDNALLLRVYTHLWCLTDSDLARRVAAETAEFLLRDLRTAEGGFASSLDADAARAGDPGGLPVEGASYVWTPDELDAVLGVEDGEWAARLLGVTVAGTFEGGASTLTMQEDPDDLDRWRRVRHALLQARRERPQPERDDKIVASWNGLAIGALAGAGVVFDEPSWVEAASDAGELLAACQMPQPGRLARVSREGQASSAMGVLDDYGTVIEGFAILFGATGDPVWYQRAEALTGAMTAHFVDEEGRFADTADDAEALVRRPRDPADNASPGGVAAAITALLTMSALGGDPTWRNRADRALADLRELQRTHPRFAGWSLAALVASIAGPGQIAIVAEADDPMRTALLRAAFRGVHAGAVVATGEPEAGDSRGATVPLLEGRIQSDGRATAFVCEGFACRLPVTRAEDLAAQLEQALQSPS